MKFEINLNDRVRIETISRKIYQGRIMDFDYHEDDLEQEGNPIGFWWSDLVSNSEEYLTFKEVLTLKVIEDTSLETALKVILKTRYEEIEAKADTHLTSVNNIVIAFIHDLICSDSSGGSDERDLASRWLSRNCIGGEFVR